jgi:MerR family transcriptional regulator, thiopeptide resistance regulator
MMDWSIQEVARLAGTTSRTLRHYDDIGLLHPSRVAANGYRHYDEDALARLQQILLLRELGLGLAQVAEVLDRDVPEEHALAAHVARLRLEQERLGRQIASIERTLAARRGGEGLMAHDMFDGFDHTQHRDEVVQRWGADAYRRSDEWWRGMDADAKASWQHATARLAREWADAASSGLAPDGDEAQALAARHVAWLRGIPGTPAADGGDIAAYVRGLADLYVDDPRFAANYATSEGDLSGARFVREALHHYADARL